MIAQSAFRIAFDRALFNNPQLKQSIQLFSASLEPDSSYTLHLTCTKQSFHVLAHELSRITRVVINLGTFKVIEIFDGQHTCKYRVEDLMIFDPTIRPSEGEYDRLLREQQSTLIS